MNHTWPSLLYQTASFRGQHVGDTQQEQLQYPACELKALSMCPDVIYSTIPSQNYAPNLANPTYLTKVNSQKFFTPYSKKQASNFGIPSAHPLPVGDVY